VLSDAPFSPLRSLEDLIDGICLIGRTLSLWNCLHHVRYTLSQALSEAEGLTSNASQSQSSLLRDSRNTTRLLEIQRLSVVFFRSLLFEGSGLSTTALGADDSLQLNSSSEIPVIPRSLVSAVSAGSLQAISETVGAVVSEVAKCVDMQRTLLDLCAALRHSNHESASSASPSVGSNLLGSLVSPIVVRGAFEFFADFVR
jgi:hypothetical protein